MDIAEFLNRSYLVIVDYYSRWIDVNKLKFKNTSEIIKKVKKICSRLIIEIIVVVSDKNPFGSNAFKLFVTEWRINIVNSRSTNRLLEKTVGIVKKKC